MSEDELGATTAASPAGAGPATVQPDFAVIHQELKRRGHDAEALVGGTRRGRTAGQSTYQYSQFTERYRDYVARLRRSMRQVHRAGEKLFVDYAGQTVPYGEVGEASRPDLRGGAGCLELYLSRARRRARRSPTGSRALVRAFEYIEGVPELVVPDNARALIADPDRYEPQASATLLRTWRRTTARRSCRRGRTSRRTRRRSSKGCWSSSAGSWRGCATGASRPSPRWISR